MFLHKMLAILLLSCLFFLGASQSAQAVDMNETLNQHVPADDGAEAATQNASKSAVASTTTALPDTQTEAFLDKLLDWLKDILAKLKNILGSLTKIAAAQTAPATTKTATPAASATPPNVPAPAAGAKGGKALLGWLQQAGLSGENLRMAWSISMAESGGDPKAFNGNARTGDKSYGLFQINMLGSLGPARMREFGLSSESQLFDPMTNIKAMLKVSNNCRNWSPWSVYKSGSYRKFYNQYPPK